MGEHVGAVVGLLAERRGAADAGRLASIGRGERRRNGRIRARCRQLIAQGSHFPAKRGNLERTNTNNRGDDDPQRKFQYAHCLWNPFN